jgi:hypothetical protein
MLCCVGELEFNKQLRDILRNFKPARLLIEPSGAGHAAEIVDTLAQYETQRALVLDSVICLVDVLDAARILGSRAASEWSQIQSADVLLVEAGPGGRGGTAGLRRIAAAQYPAKGYVGSCLNGELPPESLRHFTSRRFFAAPRPRGRAAGRDYIRHRRPGRQRKRRCSSWACGRSIGYCRANSSSRTIIEPRLSWLLDAYPGRCRLKAVLRTGPGPSWLIQSHGRGLSGEDSSYRRDSRIEMVFNTAPTAEFLDLCRTLLRDAAFVR